MHSNYIHWHTVFTAVILYRGHHWTQLVALHIERGVPNSEVDLYTALYVVGTADNVLIREVSLIWSVLYREVPPCCYVAHILNTILV